MYADETTIYFNLEDFTSDMKKAEIKAKLEKLNLWLKVNKLKLSL